MKKRIISLLMCALMLFMLCACSPDSVPAGGEPEVLTATVTFPEGRTCRQYAKLLEENGVCSATDFLEACKDPVYFEEFSFLPDQSLLDTREYPLEGYLFPDTYEFYINENPVSVVKRFLRNFERRVTTQMVSDSCLSTLGSLDSAIILASVIERETNVASETSKVSAVFHNRLNNPKKYPKLQSDATKYYPYVYGEEIPEGFVSEYNTYNVKGLPKGPICNSGLSAITGAIYPDESVDAFFFYTDINSKHYYAVTYDEHLANIDYCKKNGLAA